MLKKLLPILFLVAANVGVKAAKVDTVLTHSDIMHKDIKAVVITPQTYKKKTPYPVLYLMHGFSGNYADWVSKVPLIKQLADVYNMIIVCPDGGFSSWYMDSPVNKDWMYDTYISSELVKYIDGHYATIKDRAGRAITGLSMGGHGALYLAITHQDVYGAAGSMSGGMDLKPFAKDFGISNILGKYEDNPDSWAKHSIVGMVDQLKPDVLRLTIDCGANDFFMNANNQLHDLLLKAKIGHDFTVRPGGHSWEYWGNSVQYHALFFSRFFNKLN